MRMPVGTRRQKAGRIIAAGMTKQVTFEVTVPSTTRIDDVYRAKCQRSPYLGPILGTQARAATVRVMPRDRPTR
jgi:hypothetical protein